MLVSIIEYKCSSAMIDKDDLEVEDSYNTTAWRTGKEPIIEQYWTKRKTDLPAQF